MRLKFFFLLQLFVMAVYSQGKRVDSIANPIREERFIRINGIEQWVTIKGNNTRPVVLFLHGGPGSPLSPFADSIYWQWEKDFILVQWDQRGTARTYGQNVLGEFNPEYLRSNPLTIEQMTGDGIELTKYLLQHLGKDKIILFGSSWGSALGVRMAIANPELFYAYIGHSQLVNPSAGILLAYQKVYQLAQKANDKQSLDVLNAIGRPPYDIAKSTGQLMRITKKFQQMNATPPLASWFVLSPGYDNEKDHQSRSDGDDYSFVNYAGDTRLGVASMSSRINFFEDGLVFQIPVYFIQGKEDIQTPASVTKEYFTKIKAPEKKFILLPKTDHGFNQSVVDAHLSIMNNYIVPAISKK